MSGRINRISTRETILTCWFVVMLVCLLSGQQASAQPYYTDNFPGGSTLNSIDTVNDNFGSLGPLSNVGFFKDPGEPLHAGNAGGSSGWMTWTAPATGAYTFNVVGNFNSILAIYTGNSVAGLTAQVSSNVAGNNEAVVLNALAGVTYRIAVDGNNTGAATNTGTFNFTWAGPPRNNNLLNATSLGSVSAGQTNGNNISATAEVGEPAQFGANTGGKSVWYSWTSPITATVTFTTVGSSFDTLLSVYRLVTAPVGYGNLTLVGANDDIDPFINFQSRVTFSATAGATYYISIDGYNGDSGTLQLLWSLPPPNDDFANAATLTGVSGVTTTTTGGATFELNEPVHAQSSIGGASVWYKWTAPTSGKVNFTTSGSNYDTVLAVYTGSALSNLQLVVRDDNGLPGFADTVTFNATAGTTYYIAVDGNDAGNGAATGTLVLNWLYITSAGQFRFAASTSIMTEQEALGSVINFSDQAGVEVVVTRDNGTQGRMLVDVVAVDGTGIRPTHYVPPAVTNTLVFDDFQMRASLVIRPVNGITGDKTFSLVLTNQRVDPAVSAVTGYQEDLNLQPLLGTVQTNIVTIKDIDFATSRFARQHYTVAEGSPRGIQIWRGIAGAGHSSFIRINGSGSPNLPNGNTFTLTPGSDYAQPNNGASDPDFDRFPTGNFESGAVSWGTTEANIKTIRFDTIQDTLVEFNEDVRLFLHDTQTGNPLLDTATITIMFDDQPPGAVDRLHNRDNYNLTDPPFNTSPGANGPVFSSAVQTNGQTVIGGDFVAYNTVTRLRVARMNVDGSIDLGFDPGNGADSYVSSVVLQQDQKVLVGGGFLSFNGVPSQGVARLLTNGVVDSSFNVGSGANSPVRAMAIFTNAADAGKIMVAGEFTQFNGTNFNYLARLKSDGSLDVPSFGIGAGPNGPVYAVAISATGKIVIGGDFTEYDGVARSHVARLNSDGSLDTTFNPGGGLNDVVNAVVIQPDGKVIVGGQFTTADLRSSPHIARFNADGSLDTGYYVGTGFNDAVYTLALQPSDGRVVVGGIFTTYHGTRRIGLARLLTDGVLDTGFMDTAYNQFAGVITRLSTEPKNFISTVSVQADGNIIVGGNFLRIGGGFARDEVRPRSNVARVIGGNCEGPGDLAFVKNNYTIDENAGNLFVTLARTNGSLAAAFATFNTSDRPAGPGQATAGTDYRALTAKPIWGSIKNAIASPGTARRETEGLTGPNNATFAGPPNAGTLVTSTTEDINVNIFDNTTVEGDRVLDMQLGLTSEVQITPLGGENIPFGVALGIDQATLTIVDNDFNRGVLGFASTEFTVTENGGNATITVVRTNGSTGTVTIDYSISNGTATGGNSVTTGVDYLFRSGRLTFPSGVNVATFTIPIVNDSIAEPDETVILSLGNPAGGASTNATVLPITATLKILDNDFAPGRLGFSPTGYTVSEADGSVTLTVTRTGGNVGAVRVHYSTTDGTATSSGPTPDYAAQDDYLVWNDGDTAPKTITIPIYHDGITEALQDFTVTLDQPTILATGVINPLLLGSSTATINIQDIDIPGVSQLIASSYTISENGGQAIITVERSGGSSGTIYFDYQTVPNGTARPVYRIDTATNVDGGTYRITALQHGLANGNIVTFKGTNALPSPLATGIPYFIINKTADDFQVSTTSGGAAVTVSPAGNPGDIMEMALEIGFDPQTAVNVTPNFINLANNPYKNGDQIVFTSNVGGSLPGGITAGTLYYVVNRTASSFQIAATSGGSPITLTAGTIAGTTTLINSGEYGYYHTTGIQLTMDDGVTSKSFTVDIIDNSVQNNLLNGTYNRNFGVSINGYGNSGNPLTATVTIVDDENVNEPAGSVDQAYNALAGANGFIYSLALQSDGSLLAGGDFTTFNGLSRPRITRLFSNGNLDDQFLPGKGADGAVRAIEVQSDKKILLGGFFTNYNGTNRSRITRINYDGSIDLGFNPGAGADNPVYSVKVHQDSLNSGKIIVAGAFSKFNGQAKPHLVRLNTNGVIDASFVTGSGPDGDVYSVVIQPDGKIIIGGDFLNYNGQPAVRLARLMPNGALDSTFTAQADGSVRSLLVQRDGRILVGGFFNFVNGQSLNYLSRLLPDGTVDALFNVPPGGDRPVLSVALQPDGKILAGGDFQLFSAVTRNRITRLNSDGSADAQINFGSGADTFVSAIVVQPTDGKIVIGGGFTTFDGQTRNYLARLHGGVIAGAGKLQFDKALFTVQENQTNAVIVIRRTGGTTGTVDVDLNTSDILPSGFGKATAGLDYTALSTNVVFPHAETFKEIRLTVLDDNQIEGDEELNLTLTSLTSTLGNQPIARLRILDDDSAVSFKQGLFTVNENDSSGAAQISLVRTGGLNGTITVSLTTSDGTATAPSDYTAVNALVTFLPGETNKTVAVPIVNDNIDEGNESLNLTLTKVSGSGVVGTIGQALLTIVNDDFNPGILQFSAANYIVDENGGSVLLTVVRTNGSSGLVTVNFGTVSVGDAIGGVSPAAGVDYITTNGSLTFADGEKVKFVTVKILQDDISTETNELFQVQLSNPTGGAVLGFPNPTTVTIVNNNSAIFGQFSVVPPGSLAESGTYPITVNLTGRTTNQPVSVDYSIVGVTATAGVDFVATNGTFTFAAGQTTTNIMFTILPDNLVEAPETFQILLSNPLPNNGPSIITPVTTGTIISTNQLPGTIVFRQPVFTGTEDSLKIEFVLDRTNGVTGNVSVDVSMIAGTATLGVDYQDFVSSPLIVTWADGDSSSKTNVITIINDSLVEPDETISLNLSNPTGGAIIGTPTALAVIIDDEVKAGSVDSAFNPIFNGPVYSLSIWPATNRITAVGDFTTLNSLSRSNVAQVNLDGTLFTGFTPGKISLAGSNATVRAVAAYTNGTNIGKIIIGGRFDSVNGVSIKNLARMNPDGTVDSTFNVGSGPNAPVNAILLQPDGKVVIGGDFNNYNGVAANFVARLTHTGVQDAGFVIGAGADAPVNALALLDNGDIVVGGDFNLFAGVTSAKLARLSTTGSLVTSFSTNLGTGFNNSVFAMVQQQTTILVGGGFTSLNGSNLNYIASLNIDGTLDTLSFTNAGIAFNDSVFAIAVQADKKILAAGNFTEFNSVPHNRIVRLNADGSIDPTINFGTGADGFINSIVLQPDNKILIGGGFLNVDGQAHTSLARLNNGTNQGAGVFQFTLNDFPVNENDPSVGIVVSRIIGTAGSTSIDVKTVDGTAVSPVNYQSTVTTLVFAEGETTKEIRVPIFDDLVQATNANRVFNVVLFNPTNNVGVAPVLDNTLLSTKTNSTVTIIDNESVISFSTPTYVVAENGGTAIVTLTRTGGSNDPVSVQFQTTVGTATDAVDYVGLTNTISWAAGDLAPKTIFIPIINDTLVEGLETVGLQISGFAGSTLPGLTNAVLNIIDDDFSAGVVGFEFANYNVTESQLLPLTLVRTNGNSGIVTVQLTTSNITAIAGADYLGTNILVTFANGETRKVVYIATKDDSVQDDGETFLVHLANPTGGALLGLTDTTVTIDDNDVTIGFTTNSVHVAENNATLQLTLTRSGLLSRTFFIDYATANGTAQAGLDYLQTNGVVVFGPGETNKTIDVQILGDFIIEGPETFSISVSGTNLSLLGNTTTTVTIDDNDVATDLEVLVSVNNPVKTNTVVQYSLLVTNYGPSDISGVILTNLLPASLQIQSISVTNVTTNGNALIFDLPLLQRNGGYVVQINALDTNGIIRSVTNVASLGLPSVTNDVNLANNVVTNVTKLRGPGAYLAVDSLTLSSETPGPANGAFDIGEQVTVAVTFRNLGDVATTAATASLQGTGGVVTNVGPQNVSLGALAPNGTATRNFSFLVNGTNGGTLQITMDLADSGSVTYDPAILRYRLGGTTGFGTTNGIVINDNTSATPYPATLNVAGMVGIVDKVTLTLSNLYHGYSGDIDMLLVSPSGQSVLVMSDVGGSKLSNITFTISDQATVDMPVNGQLVNNGVYRPKDVTMPTAGDDAFVAPAPVGPYFTTMSAFRGIDPNGLWQLYVRDDTTGDTGIISNGWSLNITTVFPANQAAGLVVSGTQSPGPVLVGADLTYTIVVTNQGPSSAASVYLTNLFSGPFNFVSASNSVGGTVTVPTGRVILSLGTVTNKAIITNYVTVHPTTASTFTNLVTVGIASGETDPFTGDNAILFSQVVGASADLAVGVATSPAGPVALGNNLTYTVSVTNLGPSTATGVYLTNVLPANVNYVSGSTSQGVIARSGSLITATLGSLASNASAQLTIVVTPMVSGSLTNTVTAVSAVSDSNPLNNQAVATTTAVTDSADLKISLVGAPSPVTLGSNITYTITVTNLGPSTASGVTVTNPLPGSVTLVSYTNSQGSAAVSGGAVVFSLGSVPTGTNVTMQVVVTANAVGAVNGTAIVAASGTSDPVSGNNSATTVIAVQSAAADIDAGSSVLVTESQAPANGAIDPGETVTVRLELANKGAAPTGNLVATLLPTGGVSTNSGPQVKTYGAIASGGSAFQNYTFTATGNLGDTLSATLQLQDGATSLGTVTFTFQLGATVKSGTGTAIVGVDNGAALTYPSIVNVSGVSGTILKATVTLTNVTHTFPDDFDILLVSPSGRKMILMSDAGGGFAISGVNLTFDDNAASALPDSGQITDGVYRPSNYLNSPVDPTSTNDVFAAPAPAGPYASTLAAFVGDNPNGDWKLYVMDDQTGNIGSIGGWSLSLVTVATLAPSADVAVSVSATPASVAVRGNVTYTVTVTNSGPNTVSGVTVTNVLPNLAALQSLATAQGTIGTNGAGQVVWTIGSLAANAQFQAVIVAAPQAPGSATNVTTVAHTDIELNNANNSSTVITTVTGFVLSGGSVSATPSAVSMTLMGLPNVTYTIEASSDLVNWTVIGTSTSANGVITINDPTGTSGGLRFYRARQ